MAGGILLLGVHRPLNMTTYGGGFTLLNRVKLGDDYEVATSAFVMSHFILIITPPPSQPLERLKERIHERTGTIKNFIFIRYITKRYGKFGLDLCLETRKRKLIYQKNYCEK